MFSFNLSRAKLVFVFVKNVTHCGFHGGLSALLILSEMKTTTYQLSNFSTGKPKKILLSKVCVLDLVQYTSVIRVK